MAIKTVLTYQLNGSTTEFGVPFEYLSRRFVKVWLIGDTRRELTLNVDYRFINKKTIKTTQAWGSAQGFKFIEIRRVTSATDRVVDFTDGSILRASDLNASQVQAMHIAEEARDLAADALYVDDQGNLDARGRKIVNVGEGRESTRDAVTMQFIGKTTNSIIQMRDQVKKDTATTSSNTKIAEEARRVAEEAKNAAKSSESKAKTSENNAKSYELKAKDSMGKAQVSENNSRDSELKARADAQIAEDARIASKKSETNSKGSEINAKNSETNAKIYSDGAASNKAEIDRLAGLVKEADGLTAKAEEYAKSASDSSVASAQHAEASAQSAIQSDVNLTKCKGHEAATEVYEDEARKSKEAAKVSEVNSKTSEVKAKKSEENAKIYSDNVDTNGNRIEEVKELIKDTRQLVDQAKAFALNASNSSVASSQSAQAAAASAEQTDINLTKCKGHEAATAIYEDEAKKSKEEAKVSETNASKSEVAAVSSATVAQSARDKANQARAIAESKANEAKGSEASAAESAKASATSARQAAESANSILGQLALNTAQADRASESARQAAASASSVNANNLIQKSTLAQSSGQATNNAMSQKAVTDIVNGLGYSRPITLTTEDLNTIRTDGVYYQNVSQDATSQRNYPTQTSGILIVTSKGYYQRYMPYIASNGEYARSYVSGRWTLWIRIDANRASPLPKGQLASVLANERQDSVYSTYSNLPAPLDFPTQDAGVLRTTVLYDTEGRPTPKWIQQYETYKGYTYVRYTDDGAWSYYVSSKDLTEETGNSKSKIVTQRGLTNILETTKSEVTNSIKNFYSTKLLADSLNLDDLRTDEIYSRYTTPPSNWEELKYPIREAGTLEIQQLKGNSLACVQTYKTWKGDLYLRYVHPSDIGKWARSLSSKDFVQNIGNNPNKIMSQKAIKTLVDGAWEILYDGSRTQTQTFKIPERVYFIDVIVLDRGQWCTNTIRLPYLPDEYAKVYQQTGARTGITVEQVNSTTLKVTADGSAGYFTKVYINYHGRKEVNE